MGGYSPVSRHLSHWSSLPPWGRFGPGTGRSDHRTGLRFPSRTDFGAGLDRRRHGHRPGARRAGHMRRPPAASTIKTLLALTALDECPWTPRWWPARPTPRRVQLHCGYQDQPRPTARQLLDAVLLVSNDDARQHAAELLGGFDTANRRQDERQGRGHRRHQHHATTPSGSPTAPAGQAGPPTHDTAAIFRAAVNRSSPRSPHSRRRCSPPTPVSAR